jgi:Transposase IS66 family
VALKPRSAKAVRTITDLVFTSRGVRKAIIRYVGNIGYCALCNNEYSSPSIRSLGRQQKYGSGLQAWVTYHRMALRLPFDKISQFLEDVFHEQISHHHIYNLVAHFSQNYVITERRLLAKILDSPVVHVDETTINIQGTSQYVWVITDGRHVVFRQTESREATNIHQLFDGYAGVLCTDFYPGYDSIKCAQQKCWAHLIRDLNDDLRKSPFDTELEGFVSAVRSLIVPIFETMDKVGLKARRLHKYRKSIDRFYRGRIIGKTYRSDLVATYQKRFAKYRDKLFVFIDRDDVPWNNNMAERALRHIAVQRKISGSFGKQGILPYLLLLGVTQSCRFQNKSLLQFLVSGKKDIDLFKGQKGNIGWRMR